MPSTSSGLLAMAAALALLAGCASLQDVDALGNGPAFSISGTLASRELGKPARAVLFTWSRGPGYTGWEERIQLIDRRTGIQVAKIVSEAGEIRVVARNRSNQVDSMNELFARYVGVPLSAAELAGWLVNQHADGTAVPDRFVHGTVAVHVRQRHADGAPKVLHLTRNEDVFVIQVSKQDANS